MGLEQKFLNYRKNFNFLDSFPLRESCPRCTAVSQWTARLSIEADMNAMSSHCIVEKTEKPSTISK